MLGMDAFWLKLLTSAGLVILGYWLGRAGEALTVWLASLTQDTRDDRYWRWVGWLWWALTVAAVFSLGVNAWQLELEPFRYWGQRLSDWLGAKGLAELLIVGTSALIFRLIPKLLNRLPIANSDEFSRGQVRAQTLRDVLESVFKVVVAVVGLLFALSNLGLNITALLAGAGVVGIGVSLAAQNIIRDVLNGFFILLEDQYGIGDVITVGQLSGTVERFNLRVTVLRNLEGQVHIIPNSGIASVTVLSRDWARAVIDIGVSYRQDLAQVLEVFQAEVERFFHDPEWSPKFTTEPEVLGVQQLTDQAVILRVLFTTKPKEQWGVGREFRRRIAERFVSEKVLLPATTPPMSPV